MWLKIAFILLGVFSLASLGEGLANPCKKGLKATQFLAHPETEEKYIQCSMFGQMFVFTCPPGLVWKPASNACDRKSFTAMFAVQHQQQPSSNPEAAVVHSPVKASTPQVEVAVPAFTQPQQVQQRIQPVVMTNQEPKINFARTSEPEIVDFSTTTFQAPVLPVTSTTTAPTTTSTTTTTMTTTTPAPFVPIVNQQPVFTPTTQMQVTSTQEVSQPILASTIGGVGASSGHCDSVMVSGSLFNIVNGVYTRLASSPSIYRRSDNLQLPGLLVKTSDRQWCMTFTFSTVDFSTLTVPEVLKRCGLGLECCMLVSEPLSAGVGDIDDPNTAWIVNILENRGKQDAGIKVTCEKDVKVCAKVPFCPPECLTTRDGCDVCECNGVPFFKIHSNEIGGVEQLPSSSVLPSTSSTTGLPVTSTQQFIVSTTTVGTPLVPNVQQPVPVSPVPKQPMTVSQVPVQPVVVPSTTVQQQVVQQQPPKAVPPTVNPQIIQDQQFRPSTADHSVPPTTTLQNQELQALKDFGQSVHDAQTKRPHEDNSQQVNQFAQQVKTIEQQQLQAQVDQLNRLIASTKTPSATQQPVVVVTKPVFAGQAPMAHTPEAPMAPKIVQTFQPIVPQQAVVQQPVFAQQPVQPQVQPVVSKVGEIEERQRQELLLQQQKQQEVIARQHQEQLLKQQQQQQQLKQQLMHIQSPGASRVPGITTLARKAFASRMPQPIYQMRPLSAVQPVHVTKNESTSTLLGCQNVKCPTGSVCVHKESLALPLCVKIAEVKEPAVAQVVAHDQQPFDNMNSIPHVVEHSISQPVSPPVGQPVEPVVQKPISHAVEQPVTQQTVEHSSQQQQSPVPQHTVQEQSMSHKPVSVSVEHSSQQPISPQHPAQPVLQTTGPMTFKSVDHSSQQPVERFGQQPMAVQHSVQQPVLQSAPQAVEHSSQQPISQHMTQPVMQATGPQTFKSVDHSTQQPVERFGQQPMTVQHSVQQPVLQSQAVEQPISQHMAQPVMQATGPMAFKSFDHSGQQPVGKFGQQPMAVQQPTGPMTSQPVSHVVDQQGHQIIRQSFEPRTAQKPIQMNRINSGVFQQQLPTQYQPQLVQSNLQPSLGSQQVPNSQFGRNIPSSRSPQVQSVFNPILKAVPVTKCNMVHCPQNFVCQENPNCASCSPMCFPNEKAQGLRSFFPTCENISCPSPSKCAFNMSEKIFKCQI